MQQILFGGKSTALDTGATRYSAIHGSTWTTTESAHGSVVSTPGAIDRLFVELSAAPGAGAGDAYIFTLRKNGADTALTCTITQPATSSSDTSHTVSVVAGDVIDISCAPANTPSATPAAQWAMRFTGSNSKESLLLATAICNDAATTYAGVQGYGTVTTEASVAMVIPTSGTIKNLYVDLSADPGTSPDAYTFTLRNNGAGTTLTCTIVANSTTGNDTAHTVSVVAGDIVSISIAPVSGPAVEPTARIGLCFVADTDGESLLLCGSSNDLDSADTEYNAVAGSVHNYTVWTDTETAPQQLALACTLKKLYIALSGSPGTSKSYVFTLRNNAGATLLTATISGANTTANDLVNSATLVDGDNVAIEVNPAGGPTTRDAMWSMVCYIGAAGWAGTFNGVASPGEVLGISSASLSTVIGVT